MVSTETRIGVDATKIESASARENLLKAIKRTVPNVKAISYWEPKSLDRTTLKCDELLVAGDLFELSRAFEKGFHEWVRRSRLLYPGFCALLRTKRDFRVADQIDLLMRATDGRLILVEMKTKLDRRSELELGRFIGRLRPTALFDARYSTMDDLLWVQFGDGRQFSARWSSLPFASRTPALQPETLTVSEEGEALQVLDQRGKMFDIDSHALRAWFLKSERKEIAREDEAVRFQVGEVLRKHRRRAGLTQEELADRTDLDQAVISRIESGRQRPRFDTLQRIAAALGLELSDLLSAPA